MSSICSRRRWRLIMSCWAAAMRDCSRNFHPEAGSETTPMRFEAAFAFGQKPALTISKNECLRKLRRLLGTRHRTALDFQRQRRSGHRLSYELPALVHIESWDRERNLLSARGSAE